MSARLDAEIVRHALLSLGTEDDFWLYEGLGVINRLDPGGLGTQNQSEARDAFRWLLEKGWIVFIERLQSSTSDARLLSTVDALEALGRVDIAGYSDGSGHRFGFRATAEGRSVYKAGACCASNHRKSDDGSASG